jgi:hypothetical protein
MARPPSYSLSKWTVTATSDGQTIYFKMEKWRSIDWFEVQNYQTSSLQNTFGSHKSDTPPEP